MSDTLKDYFKYKKHGSVGLNPFSRSSKRCVSKLKKDFKNNYKKK